MFVPKHLIKKVMLILVVTGIGMVFYLNRPIQPITFESIESKTIDDHSVFNQVTLVTNKQNDVWKMRQSHQGRRYALSQWDELVIKVDKSKRPFKVSFHQLQNGLEVEFKVSCYFCHSNGPRAIRPMNESKEAPLDFSDRVSIGMMNLRIKIYGKMEIKKENLLLGEKERVTPLKYFGRRDIEPLKIAACTMCHNDQIWGRGQLTRQQTLPIRHLVSQGQMPPWPWRLSDLEKIQLEKYLKGF